mmetsp:Transcript_71129/g.169806  ORF Transcript_71129/g.169806 Transcript_71129/m.169806 type:complete len:125 (+) Transcript_71129:54-428(+)|eukprot:CAMPEP_0181413356 /NCGR_PEP_ID=MMETSP1110-20121109/8930_1 /TAXON_ID=174948 /ORGANISM="Symbiodinium sp., Strain CCMP421" /LENGTH=124 /DNA_ID=CAMNT_0023536167 /DNA_START=54 /DNA_END=428 /DNA_ORIENTATION=+
MHTSKETGAWSSSRVARPELEESSQGSHGSCYYLMMLQCLLASVFAAATLGLLHRFGIVDRASRCCTVGEGYTSCEMWQDFRSLLSFVLGAVLCCLMSKKDDKGMEELDSSERPRWSALLSFQF